MAPAEGADADVEAPSASPSRRRSGQHQHGGPAVPCSGSRRGEAPAAGTPWWRWRVRRRKRTVAPVDGAGDRVPADLETRRGEQAGRVSLLRSCCFLPPPACMPGIKKSIKGSSSDAHQKQREEQQQQPGPRNGRNPRCDTPSARQLQAATARPQRAEPPHVAPPAAATHGAGETRAPAAASRGADTSRNETPASSSARNGCPAKAACRAGELGPAAGLTVVVAVSMAGLLGGRLWAVLCVGAWFLALSRLRRKRAPPAGGGNGEQADVNSIDHKKCVVLRGLLERDRRRP